MELTQNDTNAESQTAVNPTPVQAKSQELLITPQQDAYVAFVACGGMLPTEGGDKAFKKMTAEEFATDIGVSRKTLYYWRYSIPNFWDLVAQKRKEIGSKDRLSRVWNGVYLRAAAGNPEAAKLYLANFDENFRMPMEKVQHEAGGSWAALLNSKRNVIEGEVVGEGTS